LAVADAEPFDDDCGGGRFGDHRDWPVIEAWADQIALALVGG
jgi:hypothetical protein